MENLSLLLLLSDQRLVSYMLLYLPFLKSVSNGNDVCIKSVVSFTWRV